MYKYRVSNVHTFPKDYYEELVTAKVLVFEVHHSSNSGIWDRIATLRFAGSSIWHFNKENEKKKHTGYTKFQSRPSCPISRYPYL